MKTIKQGIITASLLFFALASQSFAIESLQLAVVSTNVVLSWPSSPDQSFLVQYKATLNLDSWVTLTDYWPADTSGSNITYFVDTNGTHFPSWTTNISGGSSGTNAGGPMPPGGGSTNGANGTWLPGIGFYRVVADGATLYGVTNGMVLSGRMNLPVELANNAGQLINLTLEDNGASISSSIQTLPFKLPAPQLTLDTTLMSNGVHNICAHATWYDSGTGQEDGSQGVYEAYSPTYSVTFSNEISFPNWVPAFGELGNSLLVSAQSAHSNAQWYLDVYDSHYDYVGTLGGTTTDGNIYVVWNLIGPYGNLYTDNTFEFVLTTVHDDPVTNSILVPPTYRVNDPWSGPGDWVVVNQQAWENLVGSDLLDIEADGFTQQAQNFGLTARPATSDSTSYRLRFGAGDPNADSDWANFRAALYTNLSRNLFYLGHGSPKGLGQNQTSTNRSILATEIATNLATIPAGSTNVHRYRFVCLDGCNTASGTLPEAFGIIHRENVDANDYYNASLRPTAFVGWNDETAAGFAGSVNVSHVNYFQHFQYQWAIGDGVKAALYNAGNYPDVTYLSTNNLKVFGNWSLGCNAYNR